jgi:hypothetical protein
VTTSHSPTELLRARTDWLPRVLFAAGVALVGSGAYVHVTMGDRTLGNCVETGACNPWHPQWVLAPLLAGGVALLAAVLLARR